MSQINLETTTDSAALATAIHADATVAIRRQVAGNVNTPTGTLLLLAADNDPLTRFNLAKNPNTPKAALDVLVLRGDVMVSLRAMRHPSYR